MKTLSFWKKSLYSAIVFFGTLLVLSIGYGLVGNLSSADKVGSGSGLTATSWNRIVDGILDLDSRLSNFSFSGGNVGIGTVSPAEALVVAGAINSNNQSNNFAIGGQRVMMDMVNASKIARIGTVNGGSAPTGTQGELSFYVNSTEYIRINSSGNVGIGTTTPKAKLEVNGDFIRTIARAQGYGQPDGTDNGAIATRTLTFVKKQSDTGIRVTYSDGRRVIGVSGNGGRWEAKFNAASCANPGPLAWDMYDNLNGSDHHRTDTTIGTCFGLAAGTYTIQIYVGPAPGYAVSDLYTGWQ